MWSDSERLEMLLLSQFYVSGQPGICQFTSLKFHIIPNQKETLLQVFPSEFYEMFQSTFFTEHLWRTGSK